MVPENVYGQAKRLKWIESNTQKQDTIIELGCGKGYMITLPMAKQGYSIKGFDLDEKSIKYGKSIFKNEGLNDSYLSSKDITSLNISGDVIILSEVLEHLDSNEIDKVLMNIRSRLTKNGRLLITIPNGFGWFEFESFFWNKMRISQIFETIGIVEIIFQIKKLFWGDAIKQPPHPSTLSDSPHIQRFTLSDIRKILTNKGDFTLALAAQNIKLAIGIDFSESRILEANKRAKEVSLSCKFYRGELQSLSLDSKFDFITLNDVTEHLSDLELKSLFQEIVKYLSPAGEILIHTPNGLALCNGTDSNWLTRLHKTYLTLLKGWKGHERTPEQIYYDQVHINIKSYSQLKSFLCQFNIRSAVHYDEQRLNLLVRSLSSNMLVIGKLA